MEDLIIENEYGYICIERTIDKGMTIYFRAKDIQFMPDDHIKFNEAETLKIGKWIAKGLV
jgi:hypothetical protein